MLPLVLPPIVPLPEVVPMLPEVVPIVPEVVPEVVPMVPDVVPLVPDVVPMLPEVVPIVPDVVPDVEPLVVPEVVPVCAKEMLLTPRVSKAARTTLVVFMVLDLKMWKGKEVLKQGPPRWAAELLRQVVTVWLQRRNEQARAYKD